MRTIAMTLFAMVMSLNAFVFGVITVQLVPLLEAAGLATAAAVWVASMKGFAQFGGRVVEIVFARNLRAISVARIAVGVLAVALAILLAAQGNLYAIVAFTLLMGASQGVITIVRGALPLALFGSNRYATVLGMLATPILIVNAASPTLFALIVDRFGWQNAQMMLATIAVIACVAMEMMSRWYERTRRKAGTG
jgi:MFS family permease